MPILSPKCVMCEAADTMLWRVHDDGQICNECYEQINNIKEENDNENSNGDEKKTRKSTRATRYKTKSGATRNITKGKGRRCIFKKNPFKSPALAATTHTTESVFHKDSYIQLGDIVSLINKNDDIYYAQIRGLLIDTFGEKSAYLSWLIPTTASPPPNERFDPSSYLIGPDEDFPRKLSCMKFVMHAPSSYYHDLNVPFPLPDFLNYETNYMGFIWTRLREQDAPK